MSERPDFFRNELLAALKIVQMGRIPAAKMKSAWSGRHGASAVHAVSLFEARG